MSDKLTDLANAIMALDRALRTIGPGVELAAIEVGGSPHARRLVDDAIRASPSFATSDLFPVETYRSAQPITELCGVPIRAAASENMQAVIVRVVRGDCWGAIDAEGRAFIAEHPRSAAVLRDMLHRLKAKIVES